jgi:hypothetical protein
MDVYLLAERRDLARRMASEFLVKISREGNGHSFDDGDDCGGVEWGELAENLHGSGG